MQLKHPCKYCIVRASCQRDCEIVSKYGDDIDSMIDTNLFTWTGLIVASLFVITIYFIICYYSSIWWITTTPFVWTGSYALLKYNDYDSNFDNNSVLEQIGMILAILPATIIIMFIIWWEKYYDNIDHLGKDHHDTLVLRRMPCKSDMQSIL